MSTIQNYIQNLATTYQEVDRVPELTEKDLLAHLALEEEMSGCAGDLRCEIGKLARYRENPDRYIDFTFGIRGSEKRVFYEMQANHLYRLAKRYQGTQEPAKTTHPFHQEMQLIKTRFKGCKRLFDKYPVTLSSTLSPKAQADFQQAINLCTALAEPAPKETKATQYIRPFRDEHGRTLYDIDSNGRELPDARGRRRGDFRYLEP